MFSYQEIVDEQDRMVDFREKHYYNIKLLKEKSKENRLEQQQMKTYKF